MKKCFMTALLSSCIFSSYADTLNYREKKYQPENHPDIKEFGIQVSQTISFFGKDKAYATKLYAYYETHSPQVLEDYVIVQYIKGCKTQYDSLTKERKTDSMLRKQYGKYQKFIHPKWEIDSMDTDPVYSSSEGLPRHHYYRWNEKERIDHKDEHYYGNALPLRPRLYIRDIPGSAHASTYNGNSSIDLQFKVCLLKEKDVPYVFDRFDTSLMDKAIKCLPWHSKFIYIPEKNKHSLISKENICKFDNVN